ncbi:MAG: hypothetical protein K2P08_02005, partial [Oscillospiraceae bacterium]|nr:hypothetical protein [Oscillospiraceae bacterium]
MTTGNYVYDNFVRIDCGLSPQELWTSIVHETAHFTLAKQSSYGLFCFFLQQDMKAGNEECEPVLRLLDQAVERTSECYARTMELLLDASFTALSPGERARVVEERRAQPYWKPLPDGPARAAAAESRQRKGPGFSPPAVYFGGACGYAAP